jgi:hypothetical protein
VSASRGSIFVAPILKLGDEVGQLANTSRTDLASPAAIAHSAPHCEPIRDKRRERRDLGRAKRSGKGHTDSSNCKAGAHLSQRARLDPIQKCGPVLNGRIHQEGREPQLAGELYEKFWLRAIRPMVVRVGDKNWAAGALPMYERLDGRTNVAGKVCQTPLNELNPRGRRFTSPFGQFTQSGTYGDAACDSRNYFIDHFLLRTAQGTGARFLDIDQISAPRQRFARFIGRANAHQQARSLSCARDHCPSWIE